MQQVPALHTLFFSFFRIGLTSFGGHAALVSVLQEELTKKKQLINEEVVLDGLTIASMLPGPLAVNVVTYVGYQLRGWPGALTCMLAVLLPPTVLMIGIAQLYTMYSSLDPVNRFLAGAIPVIIGVILSLCYTMIKKHVVDVWQYAMLVVTIVLMFFFHSYLSILLYILVGGFAGFLMRERGRERAPAESPNPDLNRKSLLMGFMLVLTVFGVLFFWLDGLYHQLLFEFAEVSLTLFGGGYVMIPILHQIVVENFQWLSSAEFANAITFGQITPGPILVSATYVGFVKGGIMGAVLATIGIFLPSAMVMVLVASVLEGVKKNPLLIGALRGIRPVVIGLIAYSGWILMDSSGRLVFSIPIALLSFVVLTFTKVNYFILILGAGMIGLFTL